MKNKRTKSNPSLPNRNNRKIEQPSAPPIITNTNKEKDNFKFISQEYSKYLKCPLCSQLMIRPMRFHPCAHSFCLKCVEHLINVTKKFCPLQSCLSKCQNIQNDRTAQSLIDELKVACTHQGCTWKGQYDNYKKTHKDTCALKGMGLDKYLQELRRIPIVARSSFDHELPGDVQRIEEHKSMIQSENFIRNSYREEEPSHVQAIKQQLSHHENEIQKHQQESNLREIQMQKQQNHLQEKQKVQQIHQENIQKQQLIVENNSPNQNQIPIIQEIVIRQQQKQKVQQIYPSQPQPQQIQLQQNQSIRINNNRIIFNIPFGPSIQMQIQIEQRRRSNYISKQLKKLQ